MQPIHPILCSICIMHLHLNVSPLCIDYACGLLKLSHFCTCNINSNFVLYAYDIHFTIPLTILSHLCISNITSNIYIQYMLLYSCAVSLVLPVLPRYAQLHISQYFQVPVYGSVTFFIGQLLYVTKFILLA